MGGVRGGGAHFAAAVQTIISPLAAAVLACRLIDVAFLAHLLGDRWLHHLPAKKHHQ